VTAIVGVGEGPIVGVALAIVPPPAIAVFWMIVGDSGGTGAGATHAAAWADKARINGAAAADRTTRARPGDVG